MTASRRSSRASRRADRNPGVHIMTGPIFVEDARPGDMLEVRYLQHDAALRYGSNLAANWGYLYKEFGEKERVTIYAHGRRRSRPPRRSTPTTSRQISRARDDHPLPGLRSPAGAAGRARAGAPASRHRRRRARRTGTGQHHPARPRTAAISTTGASAPAR